MPILTEQERCGTLLAGKYRIDSVLGRGGMGVVFRATHEHTRRDVAIKLLRPELSQDAGLAKRFIREARAASLLRHPNVVEVLDLGIEEDGTVYQVLELLDGEPLSELLEREGLLTPARTLELLLPIMEALVLAHAQGIVHRDLKPDNIFLARTHDGGVKPTLLDFGIAKLANAQTSFATRTGAVMGTPHYMAPEQARGAREQGSAIDVWAMGVIAYECVTGSVPFVAESPSLVVVQVITGRAPRADATEPSCPATLADAIEAALQPDAGARLSMRELIEALQAGAAGRELPLRASDVSRADSPKTPAVTVERTASQARMVDPHDVGLLATLDPRADGLEKPAPASDAAPVASTGERPESAGRTAWVAAGGIGVILLIGAGWWFGMSGGDATPLEQAPTEQAPTEQAPTEQALTEQAPTEQAPTEQAPAERASAAAAGPEEPNAEDVAAPAVGIDPPDPPPDPTVEAQAATSARPPSQRHRGLRDREGRGRAHPTTAAPPEPPTSPAGRDSANGLPGVVGW